MADHSALVSADLEHIVGQLAELRATIEEQRQQIARQEEGHVQQQAEIAELRAERARGTGAAQRKGRVGRTHRAGRSASRRSLLKWGGAAAAAAAVTLVASEQSAHAADGDIVHAGQTTTSSSPTILNPVGGAGPNPLLKVDNSSATGVVDGIVGVAANTGTGITGRSGGVVGVSTHGLGVFGTSTKAGGLGVFGYSSGGTANDVGVLGVSPMGYGVVASSNTGIDLWTSGTGRIQQTTQSFVGAPTTGSYNAGEQIRDSLGDLYLCVAGGSPGTWKKVAAIPAGKPGGATVFLHAPFRLFDTRPGVAGCPIDPGTPMTSGMVTTLQVTGTASLLDSTLVVPTGATGIVGDLLAINNPGSGAGFLTLQPHNVTPTLNSYLHYYPNTVQHNCVVMGLDAMGKLDVGNYNATTNVGLDISGYII